MRKILKASLTLVVVALGMTQTSHATTVSNTTYFFTGACTDCAGTGTASLVLSNYTLGQPITISNFVSFTYNGTNLLPAFTITTSTTQLNVSGSINVIPGPNFVQIFGKVNNQFTGFSSALNGNWSAGNVSDFGTNGIFTGQAAAVTPAPPTSILIVSALLALAAFSWRRQAA